MAEPIVLDGTAGSMLPIVTAPGDEWPSSGPIAAELWRRLYERLDRLEAEQARLIVALRAGAIGKWTP